MLRNRSTSSNYDFDDGDDDDSLLDLPSLSDIRLKKLTEDKFVDDAIQPQPGDVMVYRGNGLPAYRQSSGPLVKGRDTIVRSDDNNKTTIIGQGSRIYWCWLCKESVRGKLALDEHLFVNHDYFREGQRESQGRGAVSKRKYECDECGRLFDFPSLLKIHHDQVHTQTRDLPFSCKHCGWKFALLGNLRKHEAKIHGPNRPTTYTCKECDGGFESRKELTKHLCKAHQITPAPMSSFCVMCSASFGTLGEYLDHVASMHSLEQEFLCRYCAEIIGGSENYLEHLADCQKEHRVDKPKITEKSGKVFATETIPPNNPDRPNQPLFPYSCSLCSQMFQYEKAYVRHMLIKHKRVVGASSIAPERSVVVGTTTYVTDKVVPCRYEQPPSPTVPEFGAAKCRGCKIGFRSQSAYKRHINQHFELSGKRSLKRSLGAPSKFQCPDCGLFFVQHDDLAMHRNEMGHWSITLATAFDFDAQDIVRSDDDDEDASHVELSPVKKLPTRELMFNGDVGESSYGGAGAADVRLSTMDFPGEGPSYRDSLPEPDGEYGAESDFPESMMVPEASEKGLPSSSLSDGVRMPVHPEFPTDVPQSSPMWSDDRTVPVRLKLKGSDKPVLIRIKRKTPATVPSASGVNSEAGTSGVSRKSWLASATASISAFPKVRIIGSRELNRLEPGIERGSDKGFVDEFE